MIQRIQLALETPIGFFLIVLFGLLLALLCVYGIMALRIRQRDVYRYRHARYFEAAEKAATGYRFIGQHHGSFFGRETQVRDQKERRALCIILPPEMATTDCCDRFGRFLDAREGRWPCHLASYSFVDCNHRFVTIQQGLLSSEATPLMSLTAYVKDKYFTTIDKEKVLMTIAHTMADLHTSHINTGETLYHGFLLPATIFIERDAAHRLSHLTIADTGFVFAMGPAAFYQRTQQLARGKIPLEKYRREELLSQIAMLAPEQREEKRVNTVGPAADFFAFGTLALLLFTGNNTWTAPKWERVPSRWRPFLERCLQDNPSERPRDFNELGEWVEDPDVALTVQEGDSLFTASTPLQKEQKEISSLLAALQRTPQENEQHKKIRRKAGEERSFSDCVLAGASAMKMSRWEVAKQHYEAATVLEENHPDVLIKLAVCVYELGDMHAAEMYVNSAQALDPSASSIFQQQIAFRI